MENWNDILTATLRTDVNYVFTLLYLISWIFMGNYVFLNFVASIEILLHLGCYCLLNLVDFVL